MLALQKESEVQHLIMRYQSHLSNLEEQANTNRNMITKIYNDIRSKMNEKETQIKRNISETLEREQTNLKEKVNQLEDQLSCINQLKEEKIRIEAEPLLETLI